MDNKSIGFAGGIAAGLNAGRHYKQLAELDAWRTARDTKLAAAKQPPGAATPSDPSLLERGVDKVKQLFTPKELTSEQPPANNGEAGLWDRLKAGNIDQAGSEAHQRWGAERDGQTALATPDGQASAQALDDGSRAESQTALNAQPDNVTPAEWESLPDAGHPSDFKLEAAPAYQSSGLDAPLNATYELPL